MSSILSTLRGPGPYEWITLVTSMTLNDATVEYEDTGGAGKPLVLLHTLLADRSVYDRVIPKLAGEWRVISPNFPGYGKSDGTIDAAIEGYAAFVVNFLDTFGLDGTVT